MKISAFEKIVAAVAKIVGHSLHIQDARQWIKTERQYRGLTRKLTCSRGDHAMGKEFRPEKILFRFDCHIRICKESIKATID